jgi:hypothetical protein
LNACSHYFHLSEAEQRFGVHQADRTHTVPLLRKQKGFQDEILFMEPGGRVAVGFRLGDQKENAETYSQNGYRDALKPLHKLATHVAA